ncbi:major royal jelly protein [Trichoderma harzianum]|uniref:Major royal jelly protein n=1 Tax=Trichoderma harzianum TaxID=5544 RepID=A0A0G0ADJ4_TRIHA|nr:major royal jelly protein [Trichoderma harzianum]
MKSSFVIPLTLWSISAVIGHEILSDPGTLGPALETIHLFYDQWPTGFTVSSCGRIFVNYPPVFRNSINFTVGEIVNGREVQYPNLEINPPPGGRLNYSPNPPTGSNSEDHLIGVISVITDTEDRLWILDYGRVASTGGLAETVYGGPKLIGMHLANNTMFQKILFDQTAVPADGLSTVFPILFGSIVAKAIQLLMGSLDIGRSISAIYNLRLLNIAGLGLLVIWSLSPLGSQALLYIIRVEQTPIFSAFTVPYMDTVMLSSPFDPENSNLYGSAFETNTSDFTFRLASLNALYNGNLLQPVSLLNASMDSWGNVKIPDYASASTANGANSSGWINFQPTDDIPYSSLIGLPVILPSSAGAGNTTFALESVTAVRLSTQPHLAPNLTDLSFSQAFSEFSLSITESDITSPSPPENGVSLSELFITNPITVGLPGPAGAAWDGLTASLFGLRLQQLLNTYWIGSFGVEGVIDKLAFYPPANRLNTTATNVVWQDTYVVHWQWLTLLVIGSLLMFAAALISLYLSWETHAPEVLGYVSTLIINSPYVRDGREVGSTMSGEDRARKFAKLPLKICDVQPHADIGYIAIAQDDGSTERRGLDLDRLYR